MENFWERGLPPVGGEFGEQGENRVRAAEKRGRVGVQQGANSGEPGVVAGGGGVMLFEEVEVVGEDDVAVCLIGGELGEAME